MYREKGRKNTLPSSYLLVFLSGARSEKGQAGFDILSLFVVGGNTDFKSSCTFRNYSRLTSEKELTSLKISSTEDN